MRLVVYMLWFLIPLGLWESALWPAGAQVLIASPSSIFAYFTGNIGLLSRATLATTQNAALGFLLGNAVAIGMASVALLAPRAERFVSTLALVVFCLPMVASGPILRVISGPGDVPQIALAALAVYYTTYLALIVGLRSIPQSWSDLVTIYGRGPLKTLFTVRARASLPYLFVGLQIAAPAAFLGAMIGEFTGAERGLGVLTLRSMRALDIDATWAIAILASSLSMLAYTAFERLGRWWVGYVPAIILSPRSSPIKRTIWRRGFDVAVIALVVLLLWQLLMDVFELNRFFAKRPSDVWAYLTNQSDARSTLLKAFGETLVTTVPGYLAGLILGVGLAVGVALVPKIAKLVLPVSIALRAIPIITTAPLIVLALGRGSLGTITVVAVMIFFPTFVACSQGLRQTPGQIIDLFESYGARKLNVLSLAQIPSMLPAFFAAAKMAVPAAILAVTTTEWLATGKGLGLLMALTATTSNYNMLWSCVVIITLTAIFLYALVSFVEQVILKTYASEQVT